MLLSIASLPSRRGFPRVPPSERIDPHVVDSNAVSLRHAAIVVLEQFHVVTPTVGETEGRHDEPPAEGAARMAAVGQRRGDPVG